MLIYPDDVYKFSIASKGAYVIYFVFYMTLCWISTHHTKIIAGRSHHSISFLNENLRVKILAGRSCHLVSIFNRNLRLTLRSRHLTSFFGQKSNFRAIEGEEGRAMCFARCFFAPYKEAHASMHTSIHMSKTRAKRKNTRDATHTAPAPFSPSLMG